MQVIIGVPEFLHAQMQKFDFLLFGAELRRKLINMVDNMSRSLQAKTLSTCKGLNVVKETIVIHYNPSGLS